MVCSGTLRRNSMKACEWPESGIPEKLVVFQIAKFWRKTHWACRGSSPLSDTVMWSDQLLWETSGGNQWNWSWNDFIGPLHWFSVVTDQITRLSQKADQGLKTWMAVVWKVGVIRCHFLLVLNSCQKSPGRGSAPHMHLCQSDCGAVQTISSSLIFVHEPGVANTLRIYEQQMQCLEKNLTRQTWH